MGITYCFPILIGTLSYLPVKLMTDKTGRLKIVNYLYFTPFVFINDFREHIAILL